MITDGDLIKWYHYYDDMIIKDAGLGLVIERWKDSSYLRYTVMRADGELDWFDNWQLEAVHLEQKK